MQNMRLAGGVGWCLAPARVGLTMSKRFLIVEDHPLYAEALRLSICGGMSDVRINHTTTLAKAKTVLQHEGEFDLEADRVVAQLRD